MKNNFFKTLLLLVGFFTSIHYADAATYYFNPFGCASSFECLEAWSLTTDYVAPATTLPGVSDDIVINPSLIYPTLSNLIPPPWHISDYTGGITSFNTVTANDSVLESSISLTTSGNISLTNSINYGDITTPMISFLGESQNRGNINGAVIFQGSGSSVAGNVGTINGNVIFDINSSNHGVINGNVHFKIGSISNGFMGDATINGDAIFDSCDIPNQGTITGTITYPNPCLPKITNLNTPKPKLEAFCSTGDIITLYVDGNPTTPTVNCNQGHYILIPNQNISDGQHVFGVTTTQGGIESVPINQTITIDTSAPVAPVLISFVSGEYDNTPKIFNGTCESGSDVTIEFPVTFSTLNRSVLCSSGVFNFDFSSELNYPDFPFSINLYQTDQTNNQSPAIQVSYIRHIVSSGGGSYVLTPTSSTVTNLSTIINRAVRNPTNDQKTLNCTPYVINKTVRKNIYIPENKTLQSIINQLKVTEQPLIIDGVIGKKTISAIKNAQNKLQIKPDGVWGKTSQKTYELWISQDCK